jgi:hypothetical protein
MTKEITEKQNWDTANGYYWLVFAKERRMSG